MENLCVCDTDYAIVYPYSFFKARASLSQGSKSTVTILSVIRLQNDLKGDTFSTKNIQGYSVNFKNSK